MRNAKLIAPILLIPIFLMLAAQYHYLKSLAAPLAIPGEGLLFEVQKGESLQSVFTRLEQQGLLDSLLIPKVYARINGLGANLKAGEFNIKPGTTLPNLLTLLSSNKHIKYTVRFIEGWNFKQVLQALTEQEKLRHLLKDQSAQEIMAQISRAPDFQEVEHPEGLFYPDTYFYQKNDSDLSILQRAHRQMSRHLALEWTQREKKSLLKSPYEALILASIVEKETGHPEERGEIAGVFARRLQKGMRLQTDPTVIYGLGDRYQGNIRHKHLRQWTPYNTYRINGLPPTPIAMPGRDAIYAALHPAKGEALYFVAKGDGSHQFSVTIAEHNKAVRKYQLRRKKGYRSSLQ